MRTTLGLTRVFASGFIAALLAFACSDDTTSGNVPDEGGTGGSNGGSSSGGKAGSGGSSTGGKGNGGTNPGGGSSGMAGKAGSGTGGGITDGGDGGGGEISLCAGKTGKAQVECGQYIVEHIDACADCHTPRLAGGTPDTTKILAGNPSFADVDPADGKGNVPAPNLTQLKAKGWTPEDVMTAILDGKDKAGKGLFPAMPYLTFHNMAKADAEAIAAFILQLDPIVNDIPPREPLPPPLESALPLKPVDVKDIPDTTLDPSDVSYKDAQLGKYLATQLGVCMECHTERLPNGTIDMSKAFAGGETFDLGPPFNTVYSENLTPATNTGLKNWTPGLVKNLIKTGKTDTGETICPPMPVGPNGAFGGMTDAHALAIGAYITSLPPIENGTDSGTFPMCVLPPGPPPGDAGPDASTSKDSGGD
jgi:mono/diheme cytochrome c family protein